VASKAAEWLESLQGSGIRPGLIRMRALLKALRNPHRAYPSILVAGTNGKGSTSATLASILHEAGYRTGLYTSPHLVDIRERWMIGGQPIDAQTFEESIDALHRASDRAGITPTYFEALTLIAFIVFAAKTCEVAVLEVGMGGRLDATNVVRPIAALITPIGFDHMEYLGSTLRKIAGEKAGIIHRGSIALTSNRDEAIVDVLRRRAAKFGAGLHVVAPDDQHESPLKGDFQRQNVALAVRAAEELMPRLPKITAAAIDRGVASTQWRGRLERIVIRGKEVWVDGCHNGHAARAVAPFVAACLRRPRLFVFGIMSDKDVRHVASTLVPLFDQVIATEPYPPRSARAADLAAMARELGVDASAVPDPRRALAAALASDVAAIFVGGSLYLAGEAIADLDERCEGERRDR
jgi:dihydrofolate synthase/folylpolyglutamate synthase